MPTPTPPSIPWYRQFWPWFVMTPPLTAVIAGIATVFIAAHDPDGLVTDDYYKQGLAINDELGRERRAAELGLSALARVGPDGRLSLSLEGARGPVEDIVLRLVHPTRPHHDRTLNLTRETGNRWSAELGSLAPGRWHLLLDSAAGAWRLSGRLALPDQQQALLQPNV
ncbi:MAG: FixH family protein [Gammaproteobacteria bacterium]